MHINILELWAILSVPGFLPAIQDWYVLLMSDNITMVFYVNKQGETRSKSCVQKPYAYGNTTFF